MIESTATELPPPAKVRFGYWFVQIIVRTLLQLLYGLKITGRENVPKSGPFILASNHKSLFDPPIAGSTCPREIHFAAKKELFKPIILGPLIRYLNSIPIRRSGFDREALVRLGEALEKGGAIIIFPEGTRHRDELLYPPKPGIGLLALRYSAPIVPVFISGSREIGSQFLKRRLKIFYGPVLDPTRIPNIPEGKEAYDFIAWEVMRRIALLGGVEPPVQISPNTEENMS